MMDARGAPTAASSARLSALSLRLPSHDFGVLDRAYIQLAHLPRYAGTRRRHGTSQRENACGERIEMLIPLTTAQCRCLVSGGLTSACPINPPCCSVLLAFALHDFHKNCSPLCAHESNTNLVGLVARVPLGRWATRLERLDGRCSGVGQRLRRPRPESRVWAVGVRDESHVTPRPPTTADTRMSRLASPSVRRRPTCAVSGVRVPRSDRTDRQLGPCRCAPRAVMHPAPKTGPSSRAEQPGGRAPSRSTRAVERSCVLRGRLFFIRAGVRTQNRTSQNPGSHNLCKTATTDARA